MTTATLDRPAAPAKPAAPPALQWEVNAEGVMVGRDGPGRGLARIGLHTVGGDPTAVMRAAQAAVGETIVGPLRERVASLASVQRFGVLRREQAAVAEALHGVEVALRRAVAEREEVLHNANAGFTSKLAELDQEIAGLSARKADADARLASLAGPMRDARATAEHDADGVRARLNGEAAHALNERRITLAARLGALCGPTLTEILGVLDALHGTSVGQHGREVVAALDEIAAEAAAE